MAVVERGAGGDHIPVGTHGARPAAAADRRRAARVREACGTRFGRTLCSARACCGASRALPSSRCSRSRSASGRTPRSSASSMPFSGGPCRTRIRRPSSRCPSNGRVKDASTDRFPRPISTTGVATASPSRRSRRTSIPPSTSRVQASRSGCGPSLFPQAFSTCSAWRRPAAPISGLTKKHSGVTASPCSATASGGGASAPTRTSSAEP